MELNGAEKHTTEEKGAGENVKWLRRFVRARRRAMAKRAAFYRSRIR